MLTFMQSLSSSQITILIGVLAAVLQTTLVKGLIFKLKDFEDHHKEVINVVISAILPALLVIGSALASNGDFNRLFPHYAEAYLAAQAFYYTVIRFATLVHGWYIVAKEVKSPVAQPEVIL